MSARSMWRALVAYLVDPAPSTPMTRPPLSRGGVLRPRVTRTLVEQTVNGRYLGRAPGIHVRAQNIGACVAVISANRGLTPREDQLA